MMYRFLRKKIKKLIAPGHPHLHLLKHAKTTGFRGTGRWRAVGRHPFSHNLRYAYGHTMKEAYEQYMKIFYRNTPRKQP